MGNQVFLDCWRPDFFSIFSVDFRFLLGNGKRGVYAKLPNIPRAPYVSCELVLGLGPSHTTSFFDWRNCVFPNFHDDAEKMAKTRRQTQSRQRRGGACVDAVASAFFAFFVVWWPRPPFVDSSFEGNVRCRIILIVEKFLLGIRSFPFLRRNGDCPPCFTGFTVDSWHPLSPVQPTTIEVAWRTWNVVRSSTPCCWLSSFHCRPTVREFVSQFHWSASAWVALRNAEKKKNTDCEKVVVCKKTTPNLLFDRSWSLPSKL